MRSEIYQGNFQKYKGNVRNQEISVLSPVINFIGNLRCVAAILRSQSFFWHPYEHICKCHMVCVIGPYMLNMSYMIHMSSMAFGNWHVYVCQYGCLKKHWDLRNAATYFNFWEKLILGLKTEISLFLIFPLYFSKFPLYIPDLMRGLDLNRKYIVF